MAESQLTLTVEEREYLVGLLATVLKDTKVEEHRTRTSTYREHILQREAVIAGLMRKLGQTPG